MIIYLIKLFKCFLKCMGENGGFVNFYCNFCASAASFKNILQMYNGTLVDENVLELAEKFATSSQELQDNFVAVSVCRSKSIYLILVTRNIYL